MVDLEQEREAALARQEAKKERDLYPRLLLGDAPPGVNEEQLLEHAVDKWPGMDRDRRRRIVASAVELRAERGRRVDPGDLKDLRHPKGEAAVTTTGSQPEPTTDELKAFVRTILDRGPETHNDVIRELADDRFGATFTYQRIGNIARQVRLELKDATKPGEALSPEKADQMRERWKRSAPAAETTPQEVKPEPEAAPASDPPASGVASNGSSNEVEKEEPVARNVARNALRNGPFPTLSIDRSYRTAGHADVRLAVEGLDYDVALRVGAAVATAAREALREVM